MIRRLYNLVTLTWIWQLFQKHFYEEKPAKEININDLSNFCFTCHHHVTFHGIHGEGWTQYFGVRGQASGYSEGMHCVALGRHFDWEGTKVPKIKCRCYKFIPMDNLDYIEVCAKEKGLV